MKVGLIAKKLGMTAIYTELGERLAVTMLHIDGCSVVGKRDHDKDGYSAVVVGAAAPKLTRMSKPLRQYFAQNKIEPKRKLKEFRVNDDAALSQFEIGHELKPSIFAPGQFVDITGITVGKGFAGGMKRHNFAGLEASHGVSASHRSHGSTGGRQDPGKVFKNKKMAGHMGSARCTIQNLKVVLVDDEKSIVCVLGSVPGHKGSFVYINNSIKKMGFC